MSEFVAANCAPHMFFLTVVELGNRCVSGTKRQPSCGGPKDKPAGFTKNNVLSCGGTKDESLVVVYAAEEVGYISCSVTFL